MREKKKKSVITFCLLFGLILLVCNAVTLSTAAEDEREQIASSGVSAGEEITAVGVDITSPTEGEFLSQKDVTVEWTSQEADYHEVRLDEGTWTDVGTNTSHTFLDLNDGEHLVDVKAVNETFGNSAQDNVNFTVDTTPPQVNITDPAENDILTSSDVTANWNGSDNTSGIDYYEVRIDSNAWNNVGNNNEHSFTDVADGDHTIDVKAWDNAGNSRTDSVNLTVDTTPPQIDINEPLENEAFDVEEVTVAWNGSDATTGIDHYEVSIDNGSWIDKGIDTNHTFSNLAEGEHTAEVSGWDNAGNNRIEAVNFTVDKTPPDIEITSPTENEWLNESDVTAEWTGSDNISGIDYYEVRIDGNNWTDKGTGTSHTFSNLTEGEHTVEIRAWDNAGNNATDTANFTVDKTPPDIEITSPTESEIVNESN
ncbi:MAG: Ig-like domain-containing protein, partial [Candidatus Aenigmatarchaeota archaeon]